MTENKTTSFLSIEGGANWEFRFLSRPAEERRAAHIVAFSAENQMVSSKSVGFDASASIVQSGRVSDTSPDIATLILSVRAPYVRV